MRELVCVGFLFFFLKPAGIEASILDSQIRSLIFVFSCILDFTLTTQPLQGLA
jgi:hypothetical protein